MRKAIRRLLLLASFLALPFSSASGQTAPGPFPLVTSSGAGIDNENQIVQYLNTLAFYTASGTGMTGTTTITSTSANALAVGPSGATNPTFNVNASTASAVTGLNISSAATGGTTAITATDSGSNSSLSINAKGTGSISIATTNTGSTTIGNQNAASAQIIGSGIQLRAGAYQVETVNSYGVQIQGNGSSNAGYYGFQEYETQSTNLSAGVNKITTIFNSSGTASPNQHATGALPLETDFLIQGYTDSFVGASTETLGATLDVQYKDCTTNCTATNISAIYVPTYAFTGTVTNGYALNINAPTGATHNYAANIGGDVIFSGSAPTISTCGSGAIATGSTDHKGQITGITAATACTITFSQALGTAPACTFSNSAGTAVGISAISTAAVTTSMTALTGTLYYICF